MKIFSLIVTLFITNLYADIDENLANYISHFRIQSIKPISSYDKNKYQLGKKLFFDKILSGNRNISCSTCHSPELGTGDGLPLSLGEGADDTVSPRRATHSDQILPRNSTPLYNLKEAFVMFADGRVSYDGFEYVTPEEKLNGEYPEAYEITDELGSALAAQALFPMVDSKEMKGKHSEFAGLSNMEVWKKIVQRILKHNEYKELIQKAFPNEKNFNIGHIGNVLAEFQAVEFQVHNTPWDRYLNGDLAALTIQEKRGAEIFFTQGRCINCHSGSHFGGNSFQNIASPQVGPGKDIRHNDEGRFLVTRKQEDLYKFKVPALRNTAKTAPYFHSGSYQTLMDVINHYTEGTRSLDLFSDAWLKPFENFNYQKQLFVERDSYMLFRKKENSHPLMRGHRIRLNHKQKQDLLKFLEVSLTEI